MRLRLAVKKHQRSSTVQDEGLANDDRHQLHKHVYRRHLSEKMLDEMESEINKAVSMAINVFNCA